MICVDRGSLHSDELCGRSIVEETRRETLVCLFTMRMHSRKKVKMVVICTPMFTGALFTIAKGGDMHTSRRKGKQDVVGPCNGIDFSLNEEGNSDTGHTVDEP